MALNFQKAKLGTALDGSGSQYPRGLRAWHVTKSEEVNVGDPNSSPKDRSIDQQV